MIVGVYGTLGIFMLWASRRPEDHRSMLWFTFWSRLVHSAIMGVQALFDPAEHGHFVGDVSALLLSGVLVGWLLPRGKQAVGQPSPQ